MKIEEREGLPEGWISKRIGELCELQNGRAFKPTEWEQTGLPIVRIQNLNNIEGKYNYYQGDYDTRHYLKGGELLFAWSGTPGTSFGAHVWQGGEAVLNQHIFRVDFDESSFDKRFFRFAINQKLNDLIDVAHGGVGLRHVTKGTFESTAIVVPPLAEQIRIADKLDTLLSRVDAGRERLERVPKLVKRLRQSVLSAAVSGELTREWRGDSAQLASVEVGDPYAHTVSGASSWHKLKLEDVCDIEGGSQPPKSVFISKPQEGYIRLIQIRDYKSDKNITFIPINQARRFCDETDVMIGRYGPPLFQILRGLSGAYNVALMKAVPKERLLSKDYLFVMLRSNLLLKYIEAGSDRTAGQDGVRKELLLGYPSFLPPLPEQAEIVRRVEALFALADRLEARAQAALARYSRLTPALLAKAFRGELVPQDPADEPASVLLDRIRAQREAAEPVKKVAGRGRKPGAVTPKAEAGAQAGQAQSEPKRGRGRPRKVVAEATEAGVGAGRIPLASSQEDAIRLLQERARAEREGKQAVQAGLFGGE